jgi:undecaprenyl-diphosphatase
VSLLQAVILGIIQGATEFIPVSSSGHLIVVPRLLGWAGDQGLAFDTALHVGTLVAVVAYFRHDLKEIFVGGTRALIHRKEDGRRVNLLVAILLGSIPAAIVGLFLEDIAETTFRSPYLVASTLSVVAFVMLFADRIGKKLRSIEEMRLLDWVIIGIAQAIALVPGVSRSGITISAGLFRNLQRDVAARSSFLLSVPAVAGAAGLAVGKLIKGGFPMDQLSSFIVGIVTAAVVGYICIGFLISYLKNHSVKLFVYYRLALAVVIVLTMLFLR